MFSSYAMKDCRLGNRIKKNSYDVPPKCKNDAFSITVTKGEVYPYLGEFSIMSPFDMTN